MSGSFQPVVLAPSRRALLAGMGALGAGVLLPHASARAQTYSLIDMHCHVSAPRWEAYLRSINMWRPPVSEFSVPRLLDDMDKNGVAVVINTLNATPNYSKIEPAIEVPAAREANEYMARLRDDHPGRFGVFARLPISDVDATLREIEYSYDTLKADGVELLTSHERYYLGDDYYAPVFAELNRRRAVLYTHPHEAACCQSPLASTVRAAFLEFGTDTSRAVIRYIFSGATVRYPDMKVIFSHAGGTITSILQRFVVEQNEERWRAQFPNGIENEIRKLYFDTAQAYHPVTLKALKEMVPVSQILFGTDYPYRTATETFDGVRNSGAFTADEVTAIAARNTLAILPNLPRQRLRL